MITFSQLHHLGRLGNQILELSACIGLALKNNDTFVFPPWEHEQNFNLHGCFSTDIKVDKTYTEPFFHYAPIPYNITRDQTLDLRGFFQSYKYFEEAKEKIIEYFTPVHQFEREEGLCSLHIRRQDYLKLPDHHPTQPMSYYEKAMSISQCNKFIILSDDISWARRNFRGNMFEFSDESDPTVDLAIMTKKCQSNIICNSSFSWVGAYLNQHPDKKVIAPHHWFGKLISHSVKDLLPPEWIKT